MAARVIHFGRDDCYRVSVLRSVGYEARESLSLAQLRSEVESVSGVAAVVVSEDYSGIAEQAASITRAAAPVILFRRQIRSIDESQFDHIFAWFVPPAVWLGETARLIAESRETREQARRFRAESAAVRADSQRQQALARYLIATKPGGS